jgi:hypothetical protein
MQRIEELRIKTKKRDEGRENGKRATYYSPPLIIVPFSQ